MRGRLAACGVLLALAVTARAESVVLDDSLSQVFPPAANWEWVPYSARGGNTTLQMYLRVNVRIDVRAYAGRNARIYMVLPQEGGGAVTATWTTRGRLLPGRLVTGERALVHAGTLGVPFLEDTMEVRLTTDSRQAHMTARRLAFHFELDTP